MNNITDSIAHYFAALPFHVTTSQQAQFVLLSQLIKKWNKAFNLLGFKSDEELVVKHFVDSLVIRPYLEGDRIADIGTGAGFPGLPLALVEPDKTFVLIDSNSKKTRFVQQAIIELGLKNVSACHGRVEQLSEMFTMNKFTSITSRAFSDLNEFVQNSCNICVDQGLFIAMKGRYPKAEIAVLDAAFTLEAVSELQVPGLDAERHVVLVRNTKSNS